MNVPSRESDTIAARATAAGAAAIAVIRISGPRALELAETIAGADLVPRQALLRSFKSASGETIDRGLVIYFPPPRSFTGEAVVELQCHGGATVVDWLLETLYALGARAAEPGEFSQRAFLNDRLDLTQAEAIADLIGSGSRAAARAALRSLDGAFAERVAIIQSALTELRALCEAWLDFPEDEIDAETAAELDARAGAIESDLARIESEALSGRVLTDGLTIVLAGAPNVGKSSLLNRLAAVDAAIVSDVPGTTRDALERRVVLGGIPVDLIDTAGIRDSDDPIERAGVERAQNAIGKADLVLWVADARGGAAAAAEEAVSGLPAATPRALVLNKVDLLGPEENIDASRSSTATAMSSPVLGVSALDGTGLEDLVRLVADRDATSEGGTFSARRRHLAALADARHHLALARPQLDSALELAAEELRAVQTALSELTGAVTSDELLGEIFSTFCIGK